MGIREVLKVARSLWQNPHADLLRLGPFPSSRIIRMKSQSGFLKFIIRSGFLAEGAVYLAVGLLALQVAVGFGGETGDTKGARPRSNDPQRA